MKKRVLSLLLLTAVVLGVTVPTARAEERTVHIATAQELRTLARNCTLDTYSVGLTVLLDNDIDLGEEPFHPIPTFSGVFDGQGHSITNMTTATDGSHQGMFRYIQARGVVKNLQVEGTVTPHNSRSQVGGIAGTNFGTVENCVFSGTVAGLNDIGGVVGENYGSVLSCSAQGRVDGKRFTGGLVGYSEGTIRNCENTAKVNTSISEGGLELEQLNLSSLVSLDLTNAQDADVVSDSGGIVGFSKGTVTDCVNRGTVGYPHYGYNVGGVAGRQSGTLTACKNYGEIYGRKDVGGIVGQMEPYMLLKSTASLSDELTRLHYLVTVAMGNLTNMSAEMRTVLAEIRDSADDAKGNLPGTTSPTPTPDPDPTPDTTPTPDPDPTQPPEPMPTSEPEPVPTSDPGLAPEPGGQETAAGTVEAERLSARKGTGGFVLLAAGEPEGGGEADSGEGGLGDLLPDLGLDADLAGDLDRLAGGMGDLMSIMGSSSGALGQDLVAVSDQLSRVLIMMANAMTGNANHQILEDISETPQKDSVDGLVERCENFGPIAADRNVGGIVGTMGIEYEFDLEGTLAQTIGMGSILTSTYQTRCVCRENVNHGTVEAKWDNVGGVTGLTELGVITACQGYGSAGSTDGGYAGGVVGYSNTAVRDSYAMCDVYGQEFIGGVAGYGTQISGCASLVNVGDATACAGTIAGWADMSGDAVTGNVYVHESLGAVDGISYAGRAEPVSFETLAQRPDLPEPFTTLKLTYVADGEVVGEIEFTYGGSIDPAELPAVPQREGRTGAWPDYDYSRLYFSDTIEAVYSSRQAAVASRECRDDGPMSLVLLEGDFADGASLTLGAYTGEGPALTEGETLEKWAVNLLDGEYTGEAYTARYLPPETGRGSRVDIYLRQGDAWSQAVTGKSGSYLTFAAEGETVVFCAVEVPRAGADLVTLCAVAAGLAAVSAVAVALGRRKKKKAAVAAKAEEK